MRSIQYSLVQERLDLAKRILEQGEQLRSPALTRHEDDGWSHPYLQHDALVNYLLLTCFDILGQPDEWLPFTSWLEASKTKCERDEAVSLISPSATPIEIAKKVYKKYSEVYGVKNSFYRFMDEILAVEMRERLLSSVKITEATKDGKPVSVNNDSEKRKFLYESRNLFTHSAQPTGNAHLGLFSEMVIIGSGELRWGYRLARTEKNYEYYVRKWPFELFEIISSHIEAPLEIYDFDLECGVFVEEANIVLQGIRFFELRNLSRIVELAKGTFGDLSNRD